MEDENLNFEELEDKLQQPPDTGDQGSDDGDTDIPKDPPEAWKDVFGALGVEDVEDWDQARQTFEQYRNRYEKYPTLESQLKEQEARAKELEAKTKVSPYANDFSRTIDEMVREGAEPGEIARFVEIQSLNPQEMSDELAIKQMLKLQTPGATDSEIDAYYKQKYGIDQLEEGEQLNSATLFQIKQDATNARNQIKEKKVEVSRVDAVEQRKQMEQRMERLTQNWTEFNEKYLLSDQKITFDEDKFGINFSFQVPDETRQKIVRKATELAAQGGLTPTEEAWDQIRNFATNAVLIEHLPDLMKSIVSQVRADAEKGKAERDANVPDRKDDKEGKGRGSESKHKETKEFPFKPQGDGFL